MRALELKATTTTDRGEFTALAATYTIDRDNERIVPGAFAKSIANWQASGKMIPLHWNHSGAAQDIIGIVDPGSMRETSDGLEVKGQLDLNENDVAREAWRLMKKNAVSLSFGFLVTQAAKAADGVRDLKVIDLFEITITPSPANPDTRFLSLKSQGLSSTEVKAEFASGITRIFEEAEQQRTEEAGPPIDPLRAKGERLAFQLATAGFDIGAARRETEREEGEQEAKRRKLRDLRQRCDDLEAGILMGGRL